MIDKVKVVYGFTVSDNHLDVFLERVFDVAREHRCDCVLHVQRNHIEVNIMPFSYEGAHQISDCEGSVILQSLIHAFKGFKDPFLWDASLTSKLPF